MRFVIFIFLIVNLANSFTLKSEKNLQLLLDYDEEAFSSFSGKNLLDCYKTLHTVKTKDGKVLRYCSLGELATHSMDIDIIFSTIKTVDGYSEEFINANEAYYVVGSKFLYEIAFKDKENALKFSKEFGGEIFDLDKAYDRGFMRVDEENEKNIYKNEKKFYPMGERIYNIRCENINPKNYMFINELKVDVLKNCKELDERKAQLVLNYLWSVKRKKDSNDFKISPTDKDKCPVCGMFVYKYPKWATYLSYIDNGEKKELFFDGVKDMMKFIHNPRKNGAQSDEINYQFIYVTGYYTLETIDAKKAFYVLGSDVLGPMGNELIPFKKEVDAKIFKLDHVGTDILRFDEITTNVICKLDGRKCE